MEKLGALGIGEKEVNVRNELSRGMLAAAFLLQFLAAIDVREIRL